jgi:DNA-binding beta-propeller fold protein YncE
MRAVLALASVLCALTVVAEDERRFEARPVAMFNQHLYYGSLSRPLGLAFDPEHDELWVADSANGLIGIFRADGAELFAFGSRERLREPARVIIAPGGNIVVIEGDRSVARRFNYRGEYLGDLEIPALGPKPVIGAIAYDEAGNLYAGDNRSSQVFIVRSDGKLKSKFGTRGTDEGQFQAIAGIAIDGDGTIYVLDQQAIAVQAFDGQGNFLRGWGRHEMGAENFSLPAGIALDGRGHLLVADQLRHQIKVFSTDGKLLGIFGGLGEGSGQLSFPTDVACDREGRVYVTERRTSRVQLFELVIP